MNPPPPGPRFRGGPPNGVQVGPGQQPVQDHRNGNLSPPMNNSSSGNTGYSAGQQSSRAEKFEDQKRRIIESCFHKKEPDGAPSETYITHVSITEDASYPSSPPPTNSVPENKKQRVIIVAVRKSGRVRMHKARENTNNGTYSIGKTWVLDDLTAIESFTNAVPATPEQQQFQQRAGATGFTVTIQKPYYWQAATAKEKEFFIFSLIKIFRKYTGGRLPELTGFSPTEMDQFGGLPGGSGAQTPAQANSQPNGSSTTSIRVPSRDPGRVQEAPPEPPEVSRERRPRPSQEREAQERPLHSAPSQDRSLHSAASKDRSLYTAASQERPLHSAATRERSVRSARSNDRIHMPGSFPSSESVVPSRLQAGGQYHGRSGSQTSFGQAQSRERPSAGPQPQPFQDEQDRQGSQATTNGRTSKESLRGIGLYTEGSRAGTPSQQRPGTPDRKATPDRRPGTAGIDWSPPPQYTTHDTPPSEYGFRHDQSNHAQDAPTRLLDTKYGDLPNNLVPGRSSERTPSNQRSMERAPSSKMSVEQSEPSTAQSYANEDRPSMAASQRAQYNHTPSQEPPAPSSRNGPEPIPTDHLPPSTLPPTTNLPPTPPPEAAEQEVHRPGLGPMIRKKSKKEIASQFRKAAVAANAFKPRPGLQAGDEKNVSGDGITGVFQAPSLLKGVSQDDVRSVTPDQKADSRPSNPQQGKEVPPVKVTTSPTKPVVSPPPELNLPIAPEKPLLVTKKSEIKKPEVPPMDERRKKRRSDHSARYAKALGIHPSLLEGRTFEIESVLDDFGWGDGGRERTTFEDLEADIRRELTRVEAGSWLGAIENNDDRTAAVGDLMDKVVTECEELDCLLTLYNVELGTLSEDVAYIEAQSQGLQVQTANQKLLHTELRNLLDTISISASDLKALRDASLTKTRGIQEVEYTLAQLYTAMLTIDPKLHKDGNGPTNADQSSLHRSSSSGYGGTELSSMHAVREKKEGYRRESIEFLHRLKQYLSVKFREMEAETMDALARNRDGIASTNPTKLDDRLREKPKRDLWLYSPLMLFAREIELHGWLEMMRMYEGCSKKPYMDEFRENVVAWKRVTRKPTGDEGDVLFTTQEKESESIVGRKLTVKRGKTVRGESRLSSERPKDGKVTAYEAFAGALTEMARITFIEQNFVVEIFHASSFGSQDFLEAAATDPESREGGDLIIKKPFDPDRDMAKKVLNIMEEIYAFWPTEIQNLVDWVMQQDSLSGVGVLFALESQISEVEETNQEFLSQALSKIHDRLATQFTRFIDEQIRGIEDTKVKIKKRKGVISFMKTFPLFCLTLENMLPPTRSLDHLPIRGMVNDAYNSLNKAMFESLKFIAKESPTAQQSHPATNAGSGDPEDKEALNHHILLIENMNHYIEEVPSRANPVLEDWTFRARAEMSEHLDLYLSAVVRRPLGKLLDFLESTESLLLNSTSGASPAAIANRASHSRSVAKKVFGNYDAKEIRRGVDTLKKRIEKHFGDGDDTVGLSRELVVKVIRACEDRYLGVLDRVGKLVKEVYESSLEVGWSKEDVHAAFRR